MTAPNAPSDSALIAAAPDWVRDSVFYQVFPDRFARSGRSPEPVNLVSWDAPPSDQGYHGGDLWGLLEHLDHLDTLGINALYLTPIFQSACNHRYHTHDYERVDPLLGGDEALRQLVRAVHDRGWKIILDGVFNHAGRGFFRFNDVLENGIHSPWLNWFSIHGWPLRPYQGRGEPNYTCWSGNRALPKLRTDNPAVREYLMQVGEYWVREFQIDGWRLDVPAEIETEGFWEEFRQRVRTVNPNAYLVGEIWSVAPEWVGGRRFDALMNYPLAAAMISFAGGPQLSERLAENRSYPIRNDLDAADLHQAVQQLLDAYGWPSLLCQFNLLGSHDAPRVVNLARGDKATLRLATVLQMTLPGVPCIYYGDEIALRGTRRYDRPHRDRDARWPFPWHDETAWDREMLAFFQHVVALRRRHPALACGRFTPLATHGDLFAFARTASHQSIFTAVNRGRQPQPLELFAGNSSSPPPQPEVLLGHARDLQLVDGHWRLSLPARSAVVLKTAD